MTFGNWLRSKRIKQRLSQTEVGKILNLHRQCIWNWENDRSSVPLDRTYKLSRIYDIDEDTMLRKVIESKLVRSRDKMLRGRGLK